jgi:hypothetical protein
MRPPPPAILALGPALLLGGCADPTFHAQAEVLEDVRTVIEVSWEPLGGGEAWVEFGPTSAYGHSTPPVPDGPGRSSALLLGNKPFQDVHWRVVASGGGRTVEGPERVTTTEGVAAALPDFHLDHSDGSFDGYVLGVSWAEVAYLYIIDADADLVWYSALPMGTVSLSVDPVAGAQALRFLRVGMDHGLDQSVAITQGMDGIDREEIPTDQGHHSMVSHADGRIAWLAIDVQEYKDFGELVGDRVMTWDPAGGETRQLYSTWDHLLYDPDNTLETNFYPQGIDWTHTNTISHAPERGSYWLTMGGVDSLVEIDETTGEPLTIVGTDGYDFDPPLDAFGEGFGPHAASWTPDETLLVFDNNDATAEGPSRVLEFELDDASGTAREIWRYEGEPGMVALVLGGCDRLEDGETFIHWGTNGHLQVVDAQGRLSWSARQQSIVADATVIRDLYGR